MDWRNRKKVGQCPEDAAPDVKRALFFLMLPSLFPPHSHTCIITSTCTHTLFTVLSLSISPGNQCVEVFQSMSHFSPFAQFASCSSIHTTVPLSPSLLFDIQVECKGPFMNRPFKQARLYAVPVPSFELVGAFEPKNNWFGTWKLGLACEPKRIQLILQWNQSLLASVDNWWRLWNMPMHFSHMMFKKRNEVVTFWLYLL